MKFYKFFSKRFLGISRISWISNLFEIGITSLTIFYFGKNNDLKERGLPDWAVYSLIIFLVIIVIAKGWLEHTEDIKRDAFANPEEILNNLYEYLDFKHEDVKLTLYKIRNNIKEHKSKGVQSLGQISHGKAIEIDMDEFYSIDHLDSAIQHTPDYNYFEVKNITDPDLSQFKNKIGYSESFMELYTGKIPKYWFYQLYKTRKHEVRLVLVIESVKPIEYYDNEYREIKKVSKMEDANALYNNIKQSMLLESLIHNK